MAAACTPMSPVDRRPGRSARRDGRGCRADHHVRVDEKRSAPPAARAPRFRAAAGPTRPWVARCEPPESSRRSRRLVGRAVVHSTTSKSKNVDWKGGSSTPRACSGVIDGDHDRDRRCGVRAAAGAAPASAHRGDALQPCSASGRCQFLPAAASNILSCAVEPSGERLRARGSRAARSSVSSDRVESKSRRSPRRRRDQLVAPS